MNYANLLTSLRLISLIPMVIFFFKGAYSITLALIGFACLTDIADGYVARKFNQKTRVGAFLDPMTDKIMIFTGNTLLLVKAVIPPWYFILIAVRDVGLFTAALILHQKNARWNPKPNIFGRAAALMQGLIIFLGIFHLAFFNLKAYISIAIIICAIFTAISFVSYFINFLSLMKNKDVKNAG